MTTAIDVRAPKTVADLIARHARLERLIVEAETELVAIEEGLRVAGVRLNGQPRKRPTHTRTEAREAHRLHGLGDTTPWVQAGERQYQREHKRAKRGESLAVVQGR